MSQLLLIAPTLTDDLHQEQLDAATRLLDRLAQPLSAEDIVALVGLLPANGDTAYGLNWTILHAVEAAPSWPIWPALEAAGHAWVDTFLVRLKNGGFVRPEG